MKLTLTKLVKIFLVIFVVAGGTLVLLSLAVKYLPANQLTHECKPLGSHLQYLEKETGGKSYKQSSFCEQNSHAEFKDSWDRTIGNVAVPALLLSGLFLIPAGGVLLSRKLLRPRV